MGQVQRTDAGAGVREGWRESGEHGAATSIADDGASLCMASEAEEREWWMRGAEEHEDERERQEVSVIVGAELPKLPATSFASHPDPRLCPSVECAAVYFLDVCWARLSAHDKAEKEDRRGGGEEWRRARARTKG
jgi:hypothetical protein